MGSKNKTMEVRVIFKAIDIINGNACHFITFEELGTGERVYLQVGIGNYMMIVEGDRGELHYKEQKKRYKNKFKSFERAIYGLKQESTLIEEIHEGEATVLDEEFVAILEAREASINNKNDGGEVADLEVDEAFVREDTSKDADAALDTTSKDADAVLDTTSKDADAALDTTSKEKK